MDSEKWKKCVHVTQNPTSSKPKTWGLNVRHQGLEPRTRWLRVGTLACRMVSNDVGQDLFVWSRGGCGVGVCRLVSDCFGPHGLVSGSPTPGSAAWSSCGEGPRCWVVWTMTVEDRRDPDRHADHQRRHRLRRQGVPGCGLHGSAPRSDATPHALTCHAGRRRSTVSMPASARSANALSRCSWAGKWPNSVAAHAGPPRSSSSCTASRLAPATMKGFIPRRFRGP